MKVEFQLNHGVKMSNKERKQRYFDKVYANAIDIKCICGCDTIIKNKDKYGRPKKYVNGHNNKKYDDPAQHKREWNHRNRKAKYEYKKEYTRKRKITLISLAGGKCTVCGLKHDGNNACIFDFHHRNPKKKEFGLNQAALQRYSWAKILKEFKKCDLECSNCHRLQHWET